MTDGSATQKPYIVGQLHNGFSDQVEMFSEVFKILSELDEMYPPEQRFRVETVQNTPPTQTPAGELLIEVGEELFVMVCNAKGVFELFLSGRQLCFATPSEAQQAVSDFSQVVPGGWRIFERFPRPVSD